MRKKTKKRKIFLSCGMLTFLMIVGIVSYGTYYFLTNKKVDSETKNNISYVRSPFGASFKIKDSNNLSFISSFSHFDAPGVKEGLNNLNKQEKESEIKNQGTQEIEEANNITLALDYFKTYFSSKNIFFMADTNIKLGNQSKVFHLGQDYSMLFKDNEKYSTTLSNQVNKFSNPYDKIIYSFDNDLSISNTNYSDIKSVIKDDYDSKTGFAINTYKTLPNSIYQNGQSWIDYSSKYYSNKENNNENIHSYVKELVSDHLPVGTDLTYLNSSNIESTIRVGGWNIENFSMPSHDLKKVNVSEGNASHVDVHAINVAKIISNAKYDLIGLLEINKNTSTNDLNNFLDYLNYLNVDDNGIKKKTYKAVLSDNTPSLSKNSAMIEQVLILYNSNVLELNNEKPTFFYNNNLTNDNAFIFTKQLRLNFFSKIYD
mgnify:CR=1 FL=1